MEVKNIAVKDIKEYANNPRNISEGAISAVAESIKAFGFRVPIILDKENVIVAGHTRILAAQKLGLHEVPCIVADDLTPEQIKAFRLVDNKANELSGWDFERLDLELGELMNFDIDMSKFGFEFLEAGESYIDDFMNDDEEERKSNAESDFFSVTFTIEKEHKEKFDEYIKINGKDALKDILLSEVLGYA